MPVNQTPVTRPDAYDLVDTVAMHNAPGCPSPTETNGSDRQWGREDSNLRRLSRRVYSPFPLAARAHPLERARIVASRRAALRRARRRRRAGRLDDRAPARGARARPCSLADRATLPARQAVRRRADDAGAAAVPGRPLARRRGGGRRRRAPVPLRRGRRARTHAAGDLMTQRRRLDAFLLDAARERGPRCAKGAHVEVDDGVIRGRRRAGRRRTSSSARTARTGRPRARSGSAAGSSTASRSRGTSATTRLAASRYARPRGGRARRHPRRLRLGLPEGRPRERRRRRLEGARGRGSASTSRACARRTASTRASSTTCAATGCRCAGRGRGSRASARCSSATRPG